jgi:hypothetical protein
MKPRIARRLLRRKAWQFAANRLAAPPKKWMLRLEKKLKKVAYVQN